MNLPSLHLAKYSIGMGDRFALEAEAQLRACIMADELDCKVIPVWNKSHREHLIIGSEPDSVREAAGNAVRQLGWKGDWHVDADHIRLETADRFIPSSDFFTIDLADMIGQPADEENIRDFCHNHPELIGSLKLPGIEAPFETDSIGVERVARKYLAAIRQAGAVHRHIERAKGCGTFITEISMDETDSPQTPMELLIILAAIADEGIPVQTIAPKFIGRFNKGVDYAGDVARFEREFNDDLCVIARAVEAYGLPANLKLSVHSGSDKFSIYPAIHRAISKHSAGLHLKTAGTTWLEELIGLAEAGGDALAMVKEIYDEAANAMAELCMPYSTVIDIDLARLPAPSVVSDWTSEQFVAALRHDPFRPAYNPHLRQLLHVAFKVAAGMGNRYLEQIRANHGVVKRNVTDNLFGRHIMPVFLGL